MIERTMFIVATDLKTWGKGTTAVEALFNTLQHGSNPKKINVVKITKIPDMVDIWTSCGMNSTGKVIYPHGAKAEQFVVDSPDWLGRKYADLYNDLQDLLAGEYN